MKSITGFVFCMVLLLLQINCFSQAPSGGARRSLPPDNPGRRGVAAADSIGPLIQSAWSQGCFYNAMCPADTSAHLTCLHVPAGAGAVAMAQIMKYYSFPARGTGEHGYPLPPYGIQYANFGATTYNWGAMPASLSASNDDLATLIYHCGVAQDMVFGAASSVSGPDNIDSALVKYFGYPKTSDWKPMAGFSQSEWISMMKAELDARHPLLLSGTDSSGTVTEYFICDGYNAGGLFHINWGRGGDADGYYSLDNLQPGSVSFSSNLVALFNLAPQTPSPGSYVMDFENIPDFSTTFGNWLVNDVDKHDTYGISGYSYPLQNEPMAFLCFNPAQVTPSMATDLAIQPHGGQRFGACFSSNPPANSDWFISPKIQMGVGGSFSFWVKSYTDLYGLDSYTVAVSTTDSLPSDFTPISGTLPLETTTTWAKKTFNLSAYNNQQIYIAIHCVSADKFLMMIDDLEVKPQASSTLTADFTSDKTNIRVGETVSFSDQSSGLPNFWYWQFPGGQPGVSTLKDPAAVKYDVPGTYPVSLKVSNGLTSDSVTKTGYVVVTGYPVTMSLDFESVTDFSLTFNPWTVVDVRGGNTYGINQPSGFPYVFPHMNEPMAYICFNPSQTAPPLTNMVPHSGQKLGCSFSSAPPMNPNNKWLISPKMSLGQNAKIEFWVQAFNNLYGDEKYNVAVSLTDTDPDSFVKVNGAAEIAPVIWTLRSYDLSYYANQDVYVGIQCVTNNSFIFLIDDIMITSSLGTDEAAKADQLVVFPNPADRFLVLTCPAMGNETMTIELVDLMGKKRSAWHRAPADGKITLDMQAVPEGIYLLVVSDGNSKVVRKVSIIH